jgi:hypothetical protein
MFEDQNVSFAVIHSILEQHVVVIHWKCRLVVALHSSAPCMLLQHDIHLLLLSTSRQVKNVPIIAEDRAMQD